ncbi:MAG TPA: GNAT family N-acetyltransferase [Candidatus Kryptonia bacterium]
MKISISPISKEDLDNVIKLWNEVLPLDAITLDSLESRVLLDENFDENTFLVAKEDKSVVGFVVGTYARRVSLGDHDPKGDRCWITAFGVDPEFRRRGIGRQMIDSLLGKFKNIGKSECLIATYAPGYFVPGIDIKEYSGGIAFLKRLGFEEIARPLSMDTQLPLFRITPEAEEKEKRLGESGISVRPYKRSDLFSFIEFLGSNMPADWVRVSRINLRDMTRGIFHEDQIFVAVNEKDGQVIGYCQFEGAHFGPFGVAESFQGKGIGTVLLGRTLERMRAKGHHNAYVLWTDDIAAKVYSKFGFKETRRFAVMKKPIL